MISPLTKKLTILSRMFIILAIALLSSIESNAQYSEETILELSWGTGQYSIGRKRMTDGTTFGPGAFDTDEQGTVYIFDTINSAVKIYSSTGQFVRGFHVEFGGIIGHMDVDTDGFVWINNSTRKEVLKYNDSGTLIQRLLYRPGKRLNHEPGINVHNGEITLSFSSLAIKNSSQSKPYHNEEVFTTERTSIMQYGNNGRYTGRNYRTIIPKGAPPKIRVSENNVLLHEKLLEGLDDSYGVSFIGEDSTGNSYFKIVSLIKKSAKIYRFNTRFLLAAEIPSLPFFENRKYLGIKDLVVDSSGRIYYMCMTRNGIKIIRWKMD